MPTPRKALVTHRDLDIETFPWVEVARLSALGVRHMTDICAQIGIPYKAVYNKRQEEEDFRVKWDSVVSQSQSDSAIELLTLLWGKAREGDRPSIIELLRRLDPDSVASLATPAVQVHSDKTMILTGTRREEKLRDYKNDRVKKLKMRQHMGMEVEVEDVRNEDGR